MAAPAFIEADTASTLVLSQFALAASAAFDWLFFLPSTTDPDLEDGLFAYNLESKKVMKWGKGRVFDTIILVDDAIIIDEVDLSKGPFTRHVFEISTDEFHAASEPYRFEVIR